MLKETCGLLFNKLRDHVTEHGPDGVEPFIGSADVIEPTVIEEDLLHDEYGHRFAEF